MVVFRDISERKEADAPSRKVQNGSGNSAEHIREVFWITNPEKSRVIYISPGYEEIWGRSCDSLYAHPTSWFDALIPRIAHESEAAMNRQTLDVYDEEYRILRPMAPCAGSGIRRIRSGMHLARHTVSWGSRKISPSPNASKQN